MPARKYNVKGREFSKVSVAEGDVHAVETRQFWKGDRSWQHRAVCGRSITGTPVSLQRLSCPRCRKEIERIINS